MILKLFSRLLREVSPRILYKTAFNLCLKNMINVIRFQKRQRCNKPFFPGFMILSLTTHCNLSCQGCWISSDVPREMPIEMAREIIQSCIKKGSYYFGLVGGEPLLYPWLFQLIEEFPEAYFQLFSNGTFLTFEVAEKLHKLGNVSPLISIEGLDKESDRRRNGKGVFTSAMEALENCRKNKLLTGVASSVCNNNFEQLVDDEFIRQLIAKGAHYLWYYIYRPVGPKPHPEQTLSSEQILQLRRFIVEARSNHPIGIIDTYWDAEGRAVCPGAMGLSHHISPTGSIEFCPPMQFAFDKLEPGESFSEKIRNASFLAELRKKIAKETRGCILLNNPGLLLQWLKEMGAVDSSERNSAFLELKKMTVKPCHHRSGQEIAENNWFYKLAKKYGFFGFSAYG
ncbi:MAG: radical SAM protein [Candidatus Riflebacteria bacterium]|nr:radical SAM protein [Candidatus Riflebacteria bacterium]